MLIVGSRNVGRRDLAFETARFCHKERSFSYIFTVGEGRSPGALALGEEVTTGYILCFIVFQFSPQRSE